MTDSGFQTTGVIYIDVTGVTKRQAEPFIMDGFLRGGISGVGPGRL